MKIAVSAGHNVYINRNFDPGAVRYPHVEADITKETVEMLIPLLKAQGHDVLDVTPYNQRFTSSKAHHVARCKRVDDFKADIFLDIHTNAGGGTGPEIWVHNMGSKSVPHARKVLDNIVQATGLPSRGVKAKPGYWSVSLTSVPAMIIEGGFTDNPHDMAKLTPKVYAESIAKAFGSVSAPRPTNGEMYRVRRAWADVKSQLGAYKNLDNAKAMADKNKDYNVYDSTGRLVYPMPTQKPVEVAPKPRVTWEYYIVGQEVKNLQRELNKQFNAGLKVDGYMGDKTIAALRTVRRGARGNLTRIIQRRLIAQGYSLRYGADGAFGQETYNKVRQFQRAKDLTVDGIVGKNTWKALFRK